MPLRADAQRNYDSVVAAARAAFEAKGTQASLDDIAEQAGVGNATLYRHFPNRDSLIVETLRLPLAELSAVARELGSSDDHGTALREWCFEVASTLTAFTGLADAVVQSLKDESSPLKIACQPLQLATLMLLMKAQDAGAARADLQADEVFSLITALAWASQTEIDLRRRVEIVFAGLSS